MGREDCVMTTFFNGKLMCDYYDFGWAQCHEVINCPDGLDEDDDIDEDPFGIEEEE